MSQFFHGEKIGKTNQKERKKEKWEGTGVGVCYYARTEMDRMIERMDE